MSDHFPIGTYVELLPGRESVYTSAVAGSRGWVRARDEDSDGFQKVFIEWDKNHWRYNDEPDTWTFASHFREAEQVPDLTNAKLDTPDGGPCPSCEEYHEAGDDQMEQYIDDISHAFGLAAESDGFLLISLRRDNDPLSGIEVFLINTHRGSTDESLSQTSTSDILRFVQEQKRMRGE